MGYNKIMDSANEILELVKEEKWTEATGKWGHTSFIVSNETYGVDFYNVVKATKTREYNLLSRNTNRNQGKEKHN